MAEDEAEDLQCQLADWVAHALNCHDEMLEALEILVGDIDRNPSSLTREERIQIAGNAIAKAKGGDQ